MKNKPEVASIEAPKRSVTLCCVSEKDLPQITKWKVGKKYLLEVEVEMTGTRKGSYTGDSNPEITADFKVSKIEPLGGKSDIDKLSKRFQ